MKRDAIWAEGRNIYGTDGSPTLSCWWRGRGLGSEGHLLERVRGCRWGNKLNIRAEFCILGAAARLNFDNTGKVLFGWKF